VHELGHAFNNRLSDSPSGSLGSYQLQNPDFPNRSDFPDEIPEGWTGEYSGFASRMNVFTWQQSYALAGSAVEEFADQFLGWIYNTWESGDYRDGLSKEGFDRSSWMKDNMPVWIDIFRN
jgi:hypothetical protein